MSTDLAIGIMETKFKFPSRMENITIIEKLVDDISATYHLSSEIYGNVLVAVIEAVNNAILHGNKLDVNKRVHVSYRMEDNYLVFDISDEGPGFDFKNIPDPTLPENIEKPHGRGVFLINHLADDILYNKNGAEIILKFKVK